MGHSNNSITTVQIPILYHKMEKREQVRFRQILGRDKRIIKHYLGIIQADINGAVNIGKRAIKYFKLTKIIKIGVRVLGFAKPKAISAGNGRISPLGTVSVIQSNLEDYFESDQLIEKIKEKPSLVISPAQDEGKADRKPFSKEKRPVPVKSNLPTATSDTKRGT